MCHVFAGMFVDGVGGEIALGSDEVQTPEGQFAILTNNINGSSDCRGRCGSV